MPENREYKFCYEKFDLILRKPVRYQTFFITIQPTTMIIWSIGVARSDVAIPGQSGSGKNDG